ncbi:MAG TPA: glycosyltransferase [Terriglobia bacterium]|nr:glycosyltransferase [Terriglobia bacterium]
MNSNQTLIIYRNELLGASETFIRAQGESLRRFSPYYLGLGRIPGLALPEDRLHIISRAAFMGKGQRARFKLLGPSGSLLRKLERIHPVLIHAHFGPDATNALPVADALRVPLVATFHGYDATEADENLPKLYVKRRKLLKTRATRFLCVSEFIRGRLLQTGFPAEKILVHYTGIDTEFFRPDPNVSRSPIVLFVGRLVAKKGCQYLVRAMASVQESVPGAKLVAIGDGPLRQELYEQARGALKDFQFLGAQEPSVVRNWMNRASVFCTPSVVAESGDAEGFGMVFAEAQAMGLPVVSFASGGIPEAVAHEETGFLVKERDWEGLAASIQVLLQDPQLWVRFSQAGQSRVRKLFNIHTQANLLENIYEGAVEEYKLAGMGCGVQTTLDARSTNRA